MKTFCGECDVVLRGWVGWGENLRGWGGDGEDLLVAGRGWGRDCLPASLSTRHALWDLIKIPPWEKIRSTGAEVAGTHSSFSSTGCKCTNRESF